MATLDDLLDGGELQPFDPTLDPGEQAHRADAMAPSAHLWCLSAEQLGSPSPAKGNNAWVRAFLSTYCAGRMLLRDAEVRQLRPKTDWVWEFKTRPPDPIRIFGWIYRPTVFIACLCKFKKDVSPRCVLERECVRSYRDNLNRPKIYKEGWHEQLFGTVKR